MKRNVVLMICGIWMSAAWGQAVTGPHASLDPSLTKDAVHAMRLGAQWLAANQQESGAWSSPEYPAVSGLVLSSLLRTPEPVVGDAFVEHATRGISFLLDNVQANGCIYRPALERGGGLANYNTAVSLMTLADTGDPAHHEVIQQGRACLINGQYIGPGDMSGGMGYDSNHDRAYADLSNTVFALEALARTRALGIDQPAVDAPDLDWQAAIAFVSRCQNLRETNPAPWVSDDERDRGGFVYHPGHSMAGEAESADDEGEYLRSYGSMTYAGLLSFIYAEVDRDDPRVQAAFDWIRRHWTLEENPGMGAQGLYYGYHTLAKALNAYGEETLELPDGGQVAWRPALVEKLVSLQQIDPSTGLGFWTNDQGRWMERDPNLVTSYAMMALQTAVFGDGG